MGGKRGQGPHSPHLCDLGQDLANKLLPLGVLKAQPQLPCRQGLLEQHAGLGLGEGGALSAWPQSSQSHRQAHGPRELQLWVHQSPRAGVAVSAPSPAICSVPPPSSLTSPQGPHPGLGTAGLRGRDGSALARAQTPGRDQGHPYLVAGSRRAAHMLDHDREQALTEHLGGMAWQ